MFKLSLLFSPVSHNSYCISSAIIYAVGSG